MDLDKYNEQVKEQRTIEATKKNLMGPDGKLTVILRNLGQPIMRTQEGGFFMLNSSQTGTVGVAVDKRYLDEDDIQESIYDAKTPEEFRDLLPMELGMNPDGSLPVPTGEEWGEGKEMVPYSHVKTGWVFDGLNRGMHMEITYMDGDGILKSSYRGYNVYQEIKGDLQQYIPVPEWENWVDRLYKIAKPKEVEKRKLKNEQELIESKKNKESFLKMLRDLWGI